MVMYHTHSWPNLVGLIFFAVGYFVGLSKTRFCDRGKFRRGAISVTCGECAEKYALQSKRLRKITVHHSVSAGLRDMMRSAIQDIMRSAIQDMARTPRCRGYLEYVEDRFVL